MLLLILNLMFIIPVGVLVQDTNLFFLKQVITHSQLFFLFNVFHVRALYYTKTLITNKMHEESFIINCNTLQHVSTLLGHLQGERFVIVTLRLQFIVE
jgi:hypothetical protein